MAQSANSSWTAHEQSPWTVRRQSDDSPWTVVGQKSMDCRRTVHGLVHGLCSRAVHGLSDDCISSPTTVGRQSMDCSRAVRRQSMDFAREQLMDCWPTVPWTLIIIRPTVYDRPTVLPFDRPIYRPIDRPTDRPTFTRVVAVADILTDAYRYRTLLERYNNTNRNE